MCQDSSRLCATTTGTQVSNITGIPGRHQVAAGDDDDTGVRDIIREPFPFNNNSSSGLKRPDKQTSDSLQQ